MKNNVKETTLQTPVLLKKDGEEMLQEGLSEQPELGQEHKRSGQRVWRTATVHTTFGRHSTYTAHRALVERQTGSTSPQRAGAQLVAALKASKVCLKQPERTDLPPAVVRERRSSFTIPFDLSYVCPQCFEALQLENMNQPCLCAYKVRFTLKDL